MWNSFPAHKKTHCWTDRSIKLKLSCTGLNELSVLGSGAVWMCWNWPSVYITLPLWTTLLTVNSPLRRNVCEINKQTHFPKWFHFVLNRSIWMLTPKVTVAASGCMSNKTTLLILYWMTSYAISTNSRALCWKVDNILPEPHNKCPTALTQGWNVVCL